MTGMLLNDPALSSRLCLTLVHSFWQVALCALLAHGAGRIARGASVERDYALSVAALIGSFALCLITFFLLAPSPGPIEQQHAIPSAAYGLRESPLEKVAPLPMAGGEAAAPLSSPETAVTAGWSSPRESVAPFWTRASRWLAALYATGVVLMLVRLGIGVWQAQRVSRRGKMILDGPVVELARSVSARLSLRVVPRLMQVEELLLPRVVGLLWPRILLPAAALSGLSPLEVEFVLIHEMAHLRRHDMWVNLLQRLAEAVLFFNPALWYLSRRISNLREFCCDELTCRVSDPVTQRTRIEYAQALLKVAELAHRALGGSEKAGSPDHDDLIALAIGGSSSSQLRRRIMALVGEPAREPLRLSVGGLVIVAAVSLTVLFGPWRLAAKTTNAADQPTAGPTVPAKEQPKPKDAGAKDSLRQSQLAKPAKPISQPASKMSPGLARLVDASRSAREGVHTAVGTATFSSWSRYGDEKEPKLMTRGTLQSYYDRGKYNVRFNHEKLMCWCRTIPQGVFASRKKGEVGLFRDKAGALVEVPAKLCDCKPDHAIILDDGQTLTLTEYTPRIQPNGVRTTEERNLRNTCAKLGLLLGDPVLLGRGFVDMEVLVKNLGADAIQLTPLSEGGYHGTYRLKNSNTRAEFDAPAKAGFHVTVQQTFNKGRDLPAQVARATWKLIDGQWFVTRVSIEMRIAPYKLNHFEQSTKTEIEYTALRINCPVDPAAFTEAGTSETWAPKGTSAMPRQSDITQVFSFYVGLTR